MLLFAVFENGNVPSKKTLKRVHASFRQTRRPKFLRFICGTNQPDLYEYTCFVFGAKCSRSKQKNSSSAIYAIFADRKSIYAIFALQTCGDDNKNYSPHIKEFIDSKFDMDDFYESTNNTVEESLQLSTDQRKVLATDNFNLTKWITTNPEILSAITLQHRAISQNELNDPNTTKRILRVKRKISSDSLLFQPKKIPDLRRKKPTQRNLLNTLSSIFEPIGFAVPVTFRLQNLQQHIWRKRLKWDD